MYKKIKIYKHNQNSSGTISQSDTKEILSLLNTAKFSEHSFFVNLLSKLTRILGFQVYKLTKTLGVQGIIESFMCQNGIHQKSKHRVEAHKVICLSIIEEIHKEIEAEFSWEYQDNCHTWARKIHEKLGLNIVTGYLYEKEKFGQSNLKLTAHSVVRNCLGQLVELTITFSPDSYLFIEHNSGKLGIDLEAQK